MIKVAQRSEAAALGRAASLQVDMRFQRLFVAICLTVVTVHAQRGWTPLWNGKNLDGWTTWMRQPAPTSEVPGLKRNADGSYAEPIGSGRDPLRVFTVVNNVDGRPAIRISGEVFGELRTKASFKDYHLRLQFKWGEKKWPPRDRPETPRGSRGTLRRTRRGKARPAALRARRRHPRSGRSADRAKHR